MRNSTRFEFKIHLPKLNLTLTHRKTYECDKNLRRHSAFERHSTVFLVKVDDSEYPMDGHIWEDRAEYFVCRHKVIVLQTPWSVHEEERDLVGEHPQTHGAEYSVHR